MTAGLERFLYLGFKPFIKHMHCKWECSSKSFGENDIKKASSAERIKMAEYGKDIFKWIEKV